VRPAFKRRLREAEARREAVRAAREAVEDRERALEAKHPEVLAAASAFEESIRIWWQRRQELAAEGLSDMEVDRATRNLAREASDLRSKEWAARRRALSRNGGERGEPYA